MQLYYKFYLFGKCREVAAVADTILKELFFCVRCVSIVCLVSVFE